MIGLLRTTDIRAYVGVVDSTSGASIGGNDNNATASAAKYAYFRYSTVAGDTVWQAITSNGTTQTVTSTGITPDTNGHTFAVIFNDAAPNITFYIDGVLVATITTTLPPANTNMKYCLTYNGIVATTSSVFPNAVMDCDL